MVLTNIYLISRVKGSLFVMDISPCLNLKDPLSIFTLFGISCSFLASNYRKHRALVFMPRHPHLKHDVCYPIQ